MMLNLFRVSLIACTILGQNLGFRMAFKALVGVGTNFLFATNHLPKNTIALMGNTPAPMGCFVAISMQSVNDTSMLSDDISSSSLHLSIVWMSTSVILSILSDHVNISYLQ